MQNLICAVVLGVIATGALFTKDSAKVEKTMTVNRCQAVLKDGSQCKSPAEKGMDFCWRHRTANAVHDTLKGTQEGGKQAWESTKTWSSNAWESTKSGAQEAWRTTKDRAEEARAGWHELFGGKDGKSAK